MAAGPWRRKGDVAISTLYWAAKPIPSRSGAGCAVAPFAYVRPLSPWLTPSWHTQHQFSFSLPSPVQIRPPGTAHCPCQEAAVIPTDPCAWSSRFQSLAWTLAACSPPRAPSVPGSLRTGGKAPWRSLPGPQWLVLLLSQMPSQHLSVPLSSSPAWSSLAPRPGFGTNAFFPGQTRDLWDMSPGRSAGPPCFCRSMGFHLVLLGDLGSI